MQLSLFEDEKIEYYRQWDRDYDSKLELHESDSIHRQRGKEEAGKTPSLNTFIRG